VLKPVRGLDYQAYENFRSFCEQDYPRYEILFGLTDAGDPVLSVIERLRREFPAVPISVVVAPVETPNRKAGMLQLLSEQAAYDVLVASDSDMRVGPDYLGSVVAPLADESIGLVCCPYRGASPLTLTARLEALYIGVTYMPAVAVGRQVLRSQFALGASVSLRRPDLARLGGFAPLAEYLADDYQLGRQIARSGRRVHLSNYVVSSVLGDTTFRDQWDREVRWARCIRVSRPWEYPGLLLTFTTPLALALLGASGFALWAAALLAASLLFRWVVAGVITLYARERALRRWLFLLPLRDMLTALIWMVGGIGRHVVWGGERFLVTTDGRLRPAATPRPDPAQTGACGPDS